MHRQMRAQDRKEMKDYEVKRIGAKPEHRPDNSEAISMCVLAWHQLDADRQMSMNGPGAIPFTALVTWGEVNRLDKETLDLLWVVLHQLDNDRAARIDSQRKTKGKKR